MVHTGVPNDGHVYNVLTFNPGRGCNLFCNPIKSINNSAVQNLKTIWVGHGETDAGHDIFAIYHLWIHH